MRSSRRWRSACRPSRSAACHVVEAPRAAATGPARPREVANLVDAQPTIEGAGVRLRRALGSRALPMLDPFLLLDEIHSENPDDYLPGSRPTRTAASRR